MRGSGAGVHGNMRVGVHVNTVLIYGSEFFLQSQVAGPMHIRTCIVCVCVAACAVYTYIQGVHVYVPAGSENGESVGKQQAEVWAHANPTPALVIHLWVSCLPCDLP